MAIRSWTLFFLAFFNTPVFACTPVKNIGVRFDWNSSQISSVQVLRVANWIADQRLKYPNRQAVYFSGSADEQEHQAESLAWARAFALRQVVTDLGFTADELHMSQRVEVVRAGSFGAGASNDVKRADVELVPGCPHECSCQLKP